MYRTHSVLALVALHASLAQSFSWEIVTGGDQRSFIDINGTVTNAEIWTSLTDPIVHIYLIYDPVHDRLLFADYHNIYSFDISTKKIEYLLRNLHFVSSLAYDPATELLFWIEIFENIYSTSLKSEFNNIKVGEKHFILSQKGINNIAVDSCGGFIYWSESTCINRARLNGSEIENVINNVDGIASVVIDQQLQKIYWSDTNGSIKSADLNGDNIITILKSAHGIIAMTISKDFIYCLYSNDDFTIHTIMQIPRNNLKPKIFIQRPVYTRNIAANYNIKEITKENENCDSLKDMLRNNSVSTDVSLLRDHGTNVSEESHSECTQGDSGEGCDCKISVCHNYCLQGACSASAEGQLKCSCNAGYSGERCEVYECHGYCMNEGVCSLSEEGKPLCRCTAHYEGEKCHVPVSVTKFLQQANSLLEDLYNTKNRSDKGLKSS